MSWIKIDDNFADHPKFVELSNDAVATWARALGYCNRHMTDGKIGTAAARLCTRLPRPDKAIAELVKVGLWDQTEDGFQFHDYHQWNESRATRERKLNDAKERKERWKEQKRNESGTRSSGVPDASGTPLDTRPEHSAYSEAEAEIIEEKEPAKASPHVAEVFEAYLAGWRQHVNRGAEPVLSDARKRLIKARLKEHPPDVVCRAARGIWSSPWHREQGQTSLDLAMRSTANVERFSGDPPKQAGSVMRPSRPVQRSPGYQQTEERKRAEFLAENARKQQELGLIPDEYGQVF